jgi:hypothetical protein
MVSISGKAICNLCGKRLITQIIRIDAYKRILGSLKIYKHYCYGCFERIEMLLENEKNIITCKDCCFWDWYYCDSPLNKYNKNGYGKIEINSSNIQEGNCTLGHGVYLSKDNLICKDFEQEKSYIRGLNNGKECGNIMYSKQSLRDTLQKIKRKDGLVKVSKIYKELSL